MDIDFKVKPFRHQLLAYRKLRDMSGALFMEQGTGKTKTMLDIVAHRFLVTGCIDSVLIIAPKDVHRVWVEQQIPEHLALPDDMYRAAVFATNMGKRGEQQIEWVFERDYKGLRIVSVNIEALATTKKVKPLLRAFQLAMNYCLVIDESQTIKTPGIKRTRAAHTLARHAACSYILTGTPVTQGPMDLYAQLKAVGYTVGHCQTFGAFKRHFGEWEDKTVWRGGKEHTYKSLIQYRNMDILKEELSKVAVIVTKDEALDLPPKLYEERHVEMSTNQKAAYRTMAKEILAAINGRQITIELAITRMLRLHQLCGGHIKYDGAETAVALDEGKRPTKVQAIIDFLDTVDRKRKVIIWLRFRAEVAAMAAALKEEYGDESVVEYHGGTKDPDRVRARKSFQDTTSETKFFVASYAAARGLDLFAAHVVCYFSNSFSLEHRLQSEDRAHRIGLEHPVLYVDFIVPGTIDEKVVKALKQKKDVSKEILSAKTLEDWL